MFYSFVSCYKYYNQLTEYISLSLSIYIYQILLRQSRNQAALSDTLYTANTPAEFNCIAFRNNVLLLL